MKNVSASQDKRMHKCHPFGMNGCIKHSGLYKTSLDNDQQVTHKTRIK